VTGADERLPDVRPGIEVRSARPDDLESLVALCLTARLETWTGSQVCSGDAMTVADQIGVLTGLPGGTVLVAQVEGAVVGLLLGRVVGPNLFTEHATFAVEAVYVDAHHRRRGVGHALMLVAVELAIVAGAEHVLAAPIPGARGMQRFFVRLGFTPAAAHRVVATAALHRRLTADMVSGRGGPRGIDELIARRRQSRAEGACASAPDAELGRAPVNRHVSREVQTRRPLESSTTIS
jgi:GNAT superfamily N-acetyltransferase